MPLFVNLNLPVLNMWGLGKVLNMPEYAEICLCVPKSARMAFVLFVIVIPCLLERVISYFNVYTKLVNLKQQVNLKYTKFELNIN